MSELLKIRKQWKCFSLKFGIVMRNSKMDESVKFGCHFREIWVIVPSPLPFFVLWFWRRRARFHHPSFSSSSALLFFLLFTMSLMMAVNRASIEVNDDRENAVTALGSHTIDEEQNWTTARQYSGSLERKQHAVRFFFFDRHPSVTASRVHPIERPSLLSTQRENPFPFARFCYQ